MKRDPKFATNGVRFGTKRSEFGEHSEAIFQTSSFVFKTAKDAEDHFSGNSSGFIYSRFTNPTVEMFEERLAKLENAESCCATGSGMAAIFLLCLTFLRSGDRVLTTPSLFGATIQGFETILKKFGVQIDYANLTDIEDWSKKITKETKLLFLESPSNPRNELADLSKIATLAKNSNSISVVDNCILTPALQNPLDFGIDLSLHSATKFIDGQGRALGGAIAGSKKLVEKMKQTMRVSGFSLTPFNAWILLKSLETLKIRMDAHSINSKKVAEWLDSNKKVSNVYYPGLKTHPQYALASKQQQTGGALVSFEILNPWDSCAKEKAWKIIDNVNLFSRTGNLGDTRSTITHPATTTHLKLSQQQQNIAGISPGLIRLSVGLEETQDLINDLDSSFGYL